MLHFEMSPDPEDREVRFYKGPLGTSVLVVGDFLGRPDPRPIEDRNPETVNHDNFDKVRARQKSTANIWEALRLLVENSPAPARIECMNASTEDLIADFEDSPTLGKSGFYKLANPYNHQGMRPYSVMVIAEHIDGYLLQQLSAVSRIKNLPILVEGAGAMDKAKPESRYVVPCPAGALLTAGRILHGFLHDEPPPNLVTCGGTPLSALLLLTRFAQQVLHIDYHRECPSRTRDAHAMMEILNGGLAARLRHLPDVLVRLSEFDWINRPLAETTLSVTTPDISVEDRILLHFEYA
ncbi:MAG TPA: type VI secretion system contractile sheath large subunit [Polyangium sp.]|nr:type VI secretion system contractile sheath large subunit [Polyangium sp.]